MATSDTPKSTPKIKNKADDELRSSEKWWRDQYEMLERHGYRLRPRYRPGWIPSWTGTGKSSIFFEDNIHSITDYVIDATRISDGTAVSIKRIKRYSREPEIALFLSQENDDKKNSMNHCVPILDHFSDESLPLFSFLVMPLLRWFDDPPFFFVDEVLEFIRQTLEGLVYMHGRGVAHRDCSTLNIMLEASPMYPRDFHPVAHIMDPSSRKLAPFRRRRDSPGIKYYFIDFGLATRFAENAAEDERLVTGIHGQDREVPELSAYLPYDPFAVDIFILGNVYRRELVDKYSNLLFLMDLIAPMIDEDPEERPSAAEALDRFNRLVASQSRVRLRWRLKKSGAGRIRSLFEDIDSFAREGVYITRNLLKLPRILLDKRGSL